MTDTTINSGVSRAPNIEERARKIVVEHLDVDPATVTADADFIDNLGADSLDTVELIMMFEEEFDIEIADVAGDDIKTFGAAVAYITARLAAAA